MLHLVFSHKDDQAVLDKIKFDLKDAAKQTVSMLLNVIKKEDTAMKLLIGYDLKTRNSVVDLNKYGE